MIAYTPFLCMPLPGISKVHFDRVTCRLLVGENTSHHPYSLLVKAHLSSSAFVALDLDLNCFPGVG